MHEILIFTKRTQLHNYCCWNTIPREVIDVVVEGRRPSYLIIKLTIVYNTWCSAVRLPSRGYYKI